MRRWSRTRLLSKGCGILRRMHPVFKWPSNHPVVFTLILFGLSAFFSVYGSDVRRFLHSWPKKKFNESNLKIIHNRIRLLESLHNDSYRLSLFFMWHVVDLFSRSLTYAAILAILSFFLPNQFPRFTLWAVIPSVLIGKVFMLKDVFNQLADFDKSMSNLTKSLPPEESVKQAVQVESGT